MNDERNYNIMKKAILKESAMEEGWTVLTADETKGINVIEEFGIKTMLTEHLDRLAIAKTKKEAEKWKAYFDYQHRRKQDLKVVKVKMVEINAAELRVENA